MYLFVGYSSYLSSEVYIHPVIKIVSKVFTVVWGKEKEFLTRKVMLMATARRYIMEQMEAARKKLGLPQKGGASKKRRHICG